MDNKIAVVVCSKKTTEENQSFVEHIKETCECDTHVYMIHNPNGLSLSKIYADMVVNKDGYLADSAWTYLVGEVSEDTKKLYIDEIAVLMPCFLK